MKKAVFLLYLINIAFGQSFTNISTESFSVLKYEVATDLDNYMRPAVLRGYLQITNSTDSTLFFQTPSLNFCYFRVTKGDLEIDEFPFVTLPVIGSFTLSPNESLAETISWNISPAVWDTSYRLWGVLNIATGWSPFPKDSHFVEFSIGGVGIGEAPPNSRIDSNSGEFELFDLMGRCLGVIDNPNSLARAPLPSGTYLLRPKGQSAARKTVIVR